jgi:CspA family cold shock protein
MTFATLERAFTSGSLPKELRPYTYHLLMLTRAKLGSGRLPPFAAKAIEPYCQKLLQVVREEDTFLEFVRTIGDLVLSTVESQGGFRARDGNPITQTRAFTAELLRRVGSPEISSQIEVLDYVGVVARFDLDKRYGFIDLELGGSMFVHLSDVRASGLHELRRGQRVSFDIEQYGPDSFKAVGLRVLS